MSTILLKSENLSKTFGGVQALDNFSVKIYDNNITAFIGPNGAGKTTFFNVATGYTKPDSGTVIIREQQISDLAPFLIARLGLARTFQDLRVLGQVTVLENVLLAATPPQEEGIWTPFLAPRMQARHERTRIKQGMEILTHVGLADKAEHLGSELSYGQRKLLSLACALATKPSLLLLDEPVSGLEPELAERILQTMQEFPEQGKATIFIEHNLDAVRSIADTVVVMGAGQKIAEGSPSILQQDEQILKTYLGD